ncbi:MAG: glutathione S-transferase family protein [Pseudomonadales bacterium]|nr:glutathione S-transferase family protein [Pseudomonadales bacterium]
MKLHEAPSPNARRVHVFMAEKAVELDRVVVDIRAGENIQDDYLAKNPAGRVPVLELDDGTFLSESVAICRYLEGLNPDPNLFGSTPFEAATIEMWGRRAEINFMTNVAGAFRNITGFFKDRETPVKEWGEVCAEVAPKTLTMFDEQLGQTEYLAGDRFSIADITLGVALDFAEMVKVVTIPELANLNRWRAQIAQRPSWGAS